MPTVLILEIIKLSLEISLEVIRGIPVEQRQEMWIAHERRLQFWQDMLGRLGAP